MLTRPTAPPNFREVGDVIWRLGSNPIVCFVVLTADCFSILPYLISLFFRGTGQAVVVLRWSGCGCWSMLLVCS